MFGQISLVGFCLIVVASIFNANSHQVSKSTEVLTKVLLKATLEDRSNYATAPLCASVILGLLAEGADSINRKEILEAIGVNELEKEAYKKILTSVKEIPSYGSSHVSIKNFMYVYKNYSISKSFSELAEEYYLTSVKSVERPDLMARNILPKEDTSVFKQHAMLIFNGFSFDMNWPITSFHKTSVSWDGNVVKAFGAAGNFEIGYVPEIDSTAFKLPYRNTDYNLLILLPKTKYTLDDVLKNLPENLIPDITKTLTSKPAFVTLPCFENNNITSFKSVLQKNTGLKNIFTESMDFSKISTDKLYLDDMVQQAGMNLCIDRSSAYSLTSSALAAQRVIKESIVVDKPFVFILYDEPNNIILVAGKVEQPFYEEDNIDKNSDSEKN
ncbi:serpin B5-like [Daktulosphaira vitifoliae]|uniref:serpin B5-like n=1 Tax=Daktulosphaira vitifoliae TaxID=58002 RepID=UPI0021AAAAEA|nr:serpin B5-like [Daktulosphaira vitifoliae]